MQRVIYYRGTAYRVKAADRIIISAGTKTELPPKLRQILLSVFFRQLN